MPRVLPDLFAYLDYREYLRDYYRQKKRAGRGFSFRAFTQRTGLKSPNHLKRVMDGDRNLSEEAAERYASALGLRGDEAEYFRELVRFNQAKKTSDRRTAHRRLTQFRGYRRAQRLDAQQDRYHSEWYIPAIREMSAQAGFRPDPKWIAGELVPSITERQAEKALAVLAELGMLVTDAEGRTHRPERVVSTGPETGGVHVVNYHRAMMDVAIRSIDEVVPEERDISAVTLCLHEADIPGLKERIRNFRRELLALEAPEGEGERVVQVNVQMFPLTRKGTSEP